MSAIYLFSISSHSDTIHINSLDIKLLKPDIDFSKYDYLIITSKQSSEALKQYEKRDYIDKKALCISKQSAKSYENLGGTILSIGGGYGDSLIQKIETYPKSTRWLYLRAKEVASNFVEVCNSKNYNIDELIVYESRCSNEIMDVEVQEGAVLIFTSPSSVKCYLKNHNIKTTNRVIVIGKTTAKSLPQNCNYTISEDTTIESCLKLV